MQQELNEIQFKFISLENISNSKWMATSDEV